MRIWGKLFGGAIGFMFGKFIGLVIGLWLGHQVDKYAAASKQLTQRGSSRQAIFFNTTFSVMGHVAKASGQVTATDIKIASLLMDQMRITGQARIDAQQAFRDGKASNFDLRGSLKAFRLIAMGRSDLLQMFMEIQIQTALADGKLEAKEHALLLTIAQELGFGRMQLDALLKRWQAEYQYHQQGGQQSLSIEQAYQVLGIEANVDDQQIKRSYRKLMNEHHPDKLVAKGLPPEMMELAKRKTQDIQAAYDRIKSERGMR
ncbi:co-chaperone DjlA [Shewanella sp. NIFS-20-20]|uniref:co-chaperone DjlA n=1 Tax=Shewanella sp. NIFS-20-20 TaxID=2853806 RepID=UPI001C475BC8|nr:co-chaperone DjlA [Shewanella sp. NIFS-20-20]MBV7314438.1 co-chaperone DjlA [Shewanella sp. NIFS-20-20]